MATNLFACFGFVMAFFAAFFLFPDLARRVRRRAAGTKVQRRTVAQGGWEHRLLRNGVVLFQPSARLLLRSCRVARFFEEAGDLCREKEISTTTQNLCSVACALVVVAMFIGGALTASFLVGLLAGAGIFVIIAAAVHRARERQEMDMREAIPDTLRSMSVCFRAGLSLLQTFQQVAQETHGPLRALFVRAANDLETGHTAREALCVFRDNSATNELIFVAVALDIQHKTGGSLQQVLDTASDSIRAELELRRSLRVQTAQAKLSARVVSVMPFILIALFSLISKDFLAPFFQSGAGIALLGLAVGMQVAGITAVRRLLDVEVE
ncbi:MAG: type II secretion system F family protein [Raoultibacter sp.]